MGKTRQQPSLGLRSQNILVDARGQRFDLSKPLRVHLDDDLEYRPAPEGWAHLQTVPEVCQALLSGSVLALSLDNDLGPASDGAPDPGSGYQVIDFLEQQQAIEQRFLWPVEGITIHSANPEARRRMRQSLETLSQRHPKLRVTEDRRQPAAQPRFIITGHGANTD